MDKFTAHTGVGVPLRRSNVDTDQIIPAVYLKRITRDGFEDGLFSAWRNDPTAAKISTAASVAITTAPTRPAKSSRISAIHRPEKTAAHRPAAPDATASRPKRGCSGPPTISPGRGGGSRPRSSPSAAPRSESG